MKNRKLLFAGIATILAIAIIIVIIFSTKEKKRGYNPEFSKYIAAYTSGIISKTSNIKIKFTSEFMAKVDKTQELDVDIFDITPEISGSIFWADNNTLEFIPNENLKSGTSYEVEVDLSELAKVPSSLEYFNFEFHTIKSNFEISIDELITIDRKTLRWEKIKGTIITADQESMSDIKKIVSATQKGKSLIVNWEDAESTSKFKFEIDSIERFDTASEIEINTDGASISVDKQETIKYEIPAIGDFKFTNYKIIYSPEQYLMLQFSDPLLEDQDLSGLITIGGNYPSQYIVEDNSIRLYSSDFLKGDYEIQIKEGIKNVLGFKLKKESTFMVFFEDIKPSVRFTTTGVILPSSEQGTVLPFEAVNLNAIDVTVQQIYENNIQQFFQVNDFEGDYELRRTAKVVSKKTIRLDNQNIMDLGKWNTFTLDLNSLIKKEQGAIYRISINFKKQYSVYNCAEDDKEEEPEFEELEEYESEDSDQGEYYEDYYYEDYYYYDGDYNWENRDNPCKKEYYGRKNEISQNIFASDLGLIAKKANDNSIRIFVTHIKTAEPKVGVTVEIYNFQQQLLQSNITDDNGMVEFLDVKEAHFVVAKDKKERAYLKLQDGNSLSLSKYDVSGASVKNGLKGFIYGERGVWRPGDSLFISFILEENTQIPLDHPVIFELRNPQNQIIERITEPKNKYGFYTFRLKTEPNAPTGYWNASVSIGNNKFYKTIHIETIKPNRLKIKLAFDKEYLSKNFAAIGNLSVKWLHGATAKNLRANIDVVLKSTDTYFEKFKEYTFDDPTKNYYNDEYTIFKGDVDGNGNATINTDISVNDRAPGKLKATFVTKVFETGGNFSIDQVSIPYHPYKSYVGIKPPKAKNLWGALETDTLHTVEFVIVDENGKLVPDNHLLEVSFYKVSWRWWWDNSSNYTDYSSSLYNDLIKTEKIYSKNGKANWTIQVNQPDWGRYLVKVYDKTSGHSTANFVYMDWPGWAGRSRKEMPDGASMLTFVADKEKYNVNENVTLTIPSGKDGRALISIESGTKIIENYWVETIEGETKFSFKATSQMSPNVYVHVTMLQPHNQTANDLPIRLYGIVPIYIENEATHLEPIIEMPDKLRSEQKVNITISEKNKRDMSYTIAIVDEGLLDITHFLTPQPWDIFYAKEALGVQTWDMFDMVIGAYGYKLERLLSIGGDGEIAKDGGQKATRFKPMVKFLGPFFLEGGDKQTHEVHIPRYIGSVRTMVVAGYKKAYGNAEKTTPVIKPLMLLGTLPRVLGPGETVKLPVSVFAMENNIKNVTVNLKTNDLLQINGESSKNVKIPKLGEENIEFELKVGNKTGIAKVELTASSGKENATYEIELDVRNPNPKVTDVYAEVLNSNEKWELDFSTFGIYGTNKATIEVSSIPPLNLEKRLNYLITYPHGCLEQTTSSAFPQLYLSDLMMLTDERKASIERNVKSAITSLLMFQKENGGFAYWPGNSDVDQWATSYVGHFLLEAKKKGYNVSESVLKKWAKYQKSRASNWTDDGNRSQFTQAYRLFTLALANEAEIGAMNRLREKSNLNNETKWRLAASYAIAGKNSIANQIVENLSTTVPEYVEMSYTYGSDIRDKAMILETLCLLNRQKDAFMILKDISDNISKDNWYSTQTTAYSLIAASKFIGKFPTTSQISYSYAFANEKLATVSTKKSISLTTKNVDKLETGKLLVNNTSTGSLFARLMVEGIPMIDRATDAENNLRISIKYMMADGTIINPERIEQGTDFIAEVSISNPGYRTNYQEMALTQIFPSGWEIINSRMIETANQEETSFASYKDIRDDRVYTYFDVYQYKTKTFRVMLNASYVGKFYMPTVNVEAMYDASINARKKGKWVEVVKPE